MSLNNLEALTKPTLLRHFKGSMFMFLYFATLETTKERVIVYQGLKDGKIWVRPASEVFENVEKVRPNPTGQTYRFEVVQNAFDI